MREVQKYLKTSTKQNKIFLSYDPETRDDMTTKKLMISASVMQGLWSQEDLGFHAGPAFINCDLGQVTYPYRIIIK